MKANLDSLRSDIEAYLAENDLLVFRGFSRRLDMFPEVEWDTARYPDYKDYVKIAKQLEVRMIILHHREFAAGLIDDTLDDLELQYDYDEDGSIRRRLNELRKYEGFTCAVELSFEYESTLYFWELHAPWYDEYRGIRDELDMLQDVGESDEESEDDDTLGGYYSKN